MTRLTRRTFLGGAAALAGSFALGGARGLAAVAEAASGHRLPNPHRSGIEHVIVLMMENRSFDHMLGWVPGADGKQAGLTYRNKAGLEFQTHHLRDFQGCAHPDPDHSFTGGRVQYHKGHCNGWLRSGDNDAFAIGYYTAADLPFYAHAVKHWTVFDRYFAAIMAETFPNRFYQHAAQTDRIKNSYDPATMATIWDRLAAAGISGRYYYGDTPFLALWGQKYLSIARTHQQFLGDCASGDLPAVSFVDPRFQDEESGTSVDDHPHSDVRAGQTFLHQMYEAVVRSPAWASTVFVINYDEWGGFFDHVPPARVRDLHEDRDVNKDHGLRGFRTPALVISPWARRGYVSHRDFDHTSILRMIEWRWGLEPLTIRDATAHNLAEALDFSRTRLHAPAFDVPEVLTSPACPPGSAVIGQQWKPLGHVAAQHGWRVS